MYDSEVAGFLVFKFKRNFLWLQTDTDWYRKEVQSTDKAFRNPAVRYSDFIGMTHVS